ncbi:MAG TPA: DUF1552 domain-containing protein [Polyangiaceae bacterium]|nr:DUF1552 domain-containing protein [Polyangiaceae bacterium]
MNSKLWLSRRNILRGMGVTLALPWMESLAPKAARAQAATAPKRYVFMYFSNGVAQGFWPATGSGAGAAWTPSPLQEPIAPYKQYVQVLDNVGQVELFGGNPNPSHSQLCAPTTSCTVNDGSQPVLGGPSVDQVLAQNLVGQTPFDSLQIGCSTMPSYPDGQHPAISRSVSWAASDQPLYKEVNPQAVFDRLVTQLGTTGGMEDPNAQAAAELRKARDLSVLDFVLDDATALNAKLSVGDQRRMEQFLDSVRSLEMRVQQQGTTMPTKMYTRPTMSASYNERADIKSIDENDPVGYNRNDHAELMNDLITMAFETDLTRVISHMLDDARSDYHYRFLNQREFSATGSVEIDAPLDTVLQGDLLGLHALQHDGDDNNGFATVNHWFVQKFASLIDRLSKTMEPDGSGKSIMDNTIITFMSGMQGSNHEANHLPMMLAGSCGGVFKTDYRHDFPAEVRLADVHLTILQKGFGLTNVTSHGNSGGIVDALLV